MFSVITAMKAGQNAEGNTGGKKPFEPNTDACTGNCLDFRTILLKSFLRRLSSSNFNILILSFPKGFWYKTIFDIIGRKPALRIPEILENKFSEISF